VILLLLATAVAPAREDGWIGQSTSGCGSCHGSAPDPLTTVTLWVADATVVPGAVVDAALIVATTDPERVAVGLDVSATEGALAAGVGTRLVSREITHAAPVPLEGGEVRIAFTWEAPSEAGTVRLRAAGNAVDGNGLASGDGWALGDLEIEVDPTCIDEDGDGVEGCAGDCDDDDPAITEGCQGETAGDTAADTGTAPEGGCGCGHGPGGGLGLALGFLSGVLGARGRRHGRSIDRSPASPC
jgi:hypothetical protein